MITDEDAVQISKHLQEVINNEVGGSIAEIGVSIGDSAETICKIKGDRKFYLYDTFEGHPDGYWVEGIDASSQEGRRHAANIEDVKVRLKKFPNLFFRKGIFPSTAKQDENEKFSFVNIDTDLYISTLEALKFFLPKVSEGGMITIHDYPGISGVKRAVDYYLPFFGIVPIQISDQVIVIKK